MIDFAQYSSVFSLFKRHLISIKHVETVETANGDTKVTYSITDNIKANVQSKKGKYEDGEAGIIKEYDATIYVEVDTDVKENDEIEFNKITYLVKGLAHRDMSLILYCEEV